MFIKEHLVNNIPVVMEVLKNMRSVVLGVWVKVGARNEMPEKNGISHFLEHMFFKGTKRRNVKDIAIEIDSLGGELNAFTSRETTTFYVKLLDEYLEKGIDLLSDIFCYSVFPEEEIEKEKKIIKEEIKTIEDSPDDYIHDLFNHTIWGNTGLGQSVLGKRETISSFTRDDIINHIRNYYGIENIVISCAGNFEPEKLIKLLNKNFINVRKGSISAKTNITEFRNRVELYRKELSEAHLCIGIQGLPQSSEKRYELFLLNTILGAGVSSRLFQEIREKRGLAYTIYSFLALYFDTGLWGIYAGVSRKNVTEVIDLILKEIYNLKKTINVKEFKRAKNQLKGNIMLSLESSSNRMNNIARQEIYYGKYYSPKEVIQKIDAVNIDKVRKLAEELTAKNAYALTVYGPVKEEQLKGFL